MKNYLLNSLKLCLAAAVTLGAAGGALFCE